MEKDEESFTLLERICKRNTELQYNIYQTFLFSFFQDFSVIRRLMEDEGKDKTLEATLRRQDA